MRIVVEAAAYEAILFNYDWVALNFGFRIADRFLTRVEEAIRLLGAYPNMGSIDERLANGPHSYRSFPFRPHHRIIYYVNEFEEVLHVIGFWDTRRDPASLMDGFTEE